VNVVVVERGVIVMVMAMDDFWMVLTYLQVLTTSSSVPLATWHLTSTWHSR
jgi:hypothetical protein